MEIEKKLIDNPTAPNDLCISVSHGQPQYRFDINKSVCIATAVAYLALTPITSEITQSFDSYYLQSDIPAIELYIDNTNDRNLTVSEIVRHVLTFYDLGKTHLCAIAGISRPALYAWLDNSSVPDAKNFSKIKDLYNIADSISKKAEDGILWNILEKPIKQIGVSLYELFVNNSKLDTLEISGYVKHAYEKSIEYRRSLAEWEKLSFNNSHSIAEQELNLENNI